MARFPKDLELRSKWLQFIQSIDKFFELKPSNLVCESRFCENDYTIPITSMNNNKKLKKNAVPSIIGIMCISKFKYKIIIIIYQCLLYIFNIIN